MKPMLLLPARMRLVCRLDVPSMRLSDRVHCSAPRNTFPDEGDGRRGQRRRSSDGSREVALVPSVSASVSTGGRRTLAFRSASASARPFAVAERNVVLEFS